MDWRELGRAVDKHGLDGTNWKDKDARKREKHSNDIYLLGYL